MPFSVLKIPRFRASLKQEKRATISFLVELLEEWGLFHGDAHNVGILQNRVKPLLIKICRILYKILSFFSIRKPQSFEEIMAEILLLVSCSQEILHIYHQWWQSVH